MITKFPVKDNVIDFAKRNRLDLKNIIFNGGEEFELVSTTSLKNLEKVKKNAKKLGRNLYEIGVVRNGKNVVIENNGKQYRMNDVGWLHFQ